MELRDYSDHMEDGESGRLWRWLETAGPDDWHALACFWNYDRGDRPMAWIASQRDCDRATAQQIFWDNMASLEYPPSSPLGPAWTRGGWELAHLIIGRWRREDYCRAELASDPYENPHFASRILGLPIGVPPSLFEPLPGRLPRRPCWTGELPPGVEAD